MTQKNEILGSMLVKLNCKLVLKYTIDIKNINQLTEAVLKDVFLNMN